ncbi:hypothetical protein FB549_2796 [Delftia sp. HK171]|nr:hypothetical protein FB549_2796 [Delftia sp. HK171]
MPRATKTNLELIEAVHQALSVKRTDEYFLISEIPYFSIEPLPALQDACISNWTIKIDPCAADVEVAIKHAACLVQHEYDLRID